MSTFPGCGLLVSHFETNGTPPSAIPRRAFPAVARAWPTSATGWLKLIPSSCHVILFRAVRAYKNPAGTAKSIQDHDYQRFDWGAFCRFFGVNRSASNIGINETRQRFELAGWDGSRPGHWFKNQISITELLQLSAEILVKMSGFDRRTEIRGRSQIPFRLVGIYTKTVYCEYLKLRGWRLCTNSVPGPNPNSF